MLGDKCPGPGSGAGGFVIIILYLLVMVSRCSGQIKVENVKHFHERTGGGASVLMITVESGRTGVGYSVDPAGIPFSGHFVSGDNHCC